MTLTIPQQLACLDTTLKVLACWRDAAILKGDTESAEKFDGLFAMFEEQRLTLLQFAEPPDVQKWEQMRDEIKKALELIS